MFKTRLFWSFFWLIIVISPFLAVFCIHLVIKQDHKKDVVIQIDSHGGILNLKKGQVLVVQLPVHLGTGYSWSITRNDNKRLKPLGEPTTEEDTPGRDGGTGFEIFRFQAEQLGVANLNIDYKRPWEDKAPEQIFTIQVNILDN